MRPARSRCWRPAPRRRSRTSPAGSGYWDVGVPPSGPMDDALIPAGQPPARQSGRCGRARDDAVAGRRWLQLPTAVSPDRRAMRPTLDGRAGPLWSTYRRSGRPDSADRRGHRRGPARLSRCCGAGFDVPVYLGSRATFTLGHVRRPWRAGAACRATCCMLSAPDELGSAHAAARASATGLTRDWDIGVLYGPHGAPDFFTERTSRRSSPPTGRCTTTPAAPACA